MHAGCPTLRHCDLASVLHLREQLIVERARLLDRGPHARSHEDREHADNDEDHDQFEKRKSAAIKKGASRLLFRKWNCRNDQFETAMMVALTVAPPAL